jgi:hypothetical protein
MARVKVTTAETHPTTTTPAPIAVPTPAEVFPTPDTVPARVALGTAQAETLPPPEKLVSVLENADREAARDHAQNQVFGSANAAEEVPIDPRFAFVEERVFAPIDFGTVYDVIEGWLRLGERRTEEAFIRKAHEEGPDMLQQATRLYLQAKLAREKWEKENDVMFGAMREQASEVLEAEKASGKRKKAITEADVDAKCAALFPDQYRAQEIKRRKAKLTEDALSKLVEVCGVRCRHLDTMMHKLR